MTQPGKRSIAKAGVEPRSVTLEVDALPLGQRGSILMAFPPDIWGQYHGGQQPSSDNSPSIIPPSALDKPSIMKHFTVNVQSHLFSSFTDNGNAS